MSKRLGGSTPPLLLLLCRFKEAGSLRQVRFDLAEEAVILVVVVVVLVVVVVVQSSSSCCCCCLHIKSRSGLYSVLSNIRTGPTDADAFRGHRLTTQKGYTYQKEIKGPRKVNTHAII